MFAKPSIILKTTAYLLVITAIVLGDIHQFKFQERDCFWGGMSMIATGAVALVAGGWLLLILLYQAFAFFDWLSELIKKADKEWEKETRPQ